MYRPLPLFIGLRYLRAKKRNQFISIISAISFVGIALGVAVLITVMSVMNGFDEQIKDRILMMVPPVKVYQAGGKLYDWQELSNNLKEKSKEITGTAPVIEGQGMLSANGTNAFAALQGIDPKYENEVVPISEHVTQGKLSSLQSGKFNIILGKYLAQSLGVGIGDKVTVIVPEANLTPAGMVPRLKQFTVSGIFSVSYQYDSYYALINIKDAAKLLQMGNAVSALQLGVNNIYQAPFVKYYLNAKVLPDFFIARDWTDENKSFFQALQMEKTMMFFILLLIIAVAIFNLLSSLVMVVTDKRSDIAILRTMGMSSRQIIMIFIIQGLAIGVIGTLLGIVLGIVLSLNATEIVNWIQVIFHVQFLSPSVYQIDFIPSKLVWSDIYHVGIAALVLSFLATLYPAWSASRVQPVEALRYE
ncbi:lipoprotein-releasing ABC transporter permease subunit [Fangia hongkongensis]|uniref:lipoprotein-releasing ABC transporter permease subunit n=1 Tax=Fangia hongkongensis TaxID=270495 RepID=UPI000376026C|nr:lipoprotein-releasing ABC transporter permease subunit [Fangia hongkongensis]MBK2123687.1 lipoprotein-releasing ABC transporter permease subunit [Fangia hongkongensis]